MKPISAAAFSFDRRARKKQTTEIKRLRDWEIKVLFCVCSVFLFRVRSVCLI